MDWKNEFWNDPENCSGELWKTVEKESITEIRRIVEKIGMEEYYGNEENYGRYVRRWRSEQWMFGEIQHLEHIRKRANL